MAGNTATPPDRRIVDTLVIALNAIAQTLSETQRAEAHAQCDSALSAPQVLERLGATDFESAELLRSIIDGIFTGPPSSA